MRPPMVGLKGCRLFMFSPEVFRGSARGGGRLGEATLPAPPTGASNPPMVGPEGRRDLGFNAVSRSLRNFAISEQSSPTRQEKCKLTGIRQALCSLESGYLRAAVSQRLAPEMSMFFVGFKMVYP
jgi:hypothetical protein